MAHSLLDIEFYKNCLTFVCNNLKIVLHTKGGEFLSAKKMGRPTSDPKPHRLQTRVNDEELKILEDYCERKGKTKTEGVRDGVRALKDKK